MEPGQETQRWLGFKLDVRITSLAINGKDYVGHTRVGTVSESGIGIMIPANLRVRDMAEIGFSLPDNNLIKVKGVIRDRAGFRYVFQFTDLSETQRQQIRRACEKSEKI